MSKEKEYTVEVIYPGRSGAEKIIADHFTWSDAGCYLFYRGSSDGIRTLVASYPIERTMIKRIQDVETKQ
jgi:hypothetical protein